MKILPKHRGSTLQSDGIRQRLGRLAGRFCAGGAQWMGCGVQTLQAAPSELLQRHRSLLDTIRSGRLHSDLAGCWLAQTGILWEGGSGERCCLTGPPSHRILGRGGSATPRGCAAWRP